MTNVNNTHNSEIHMLFVTLQIFVGQVKKSQ